MDQVTTVVLVQWDLLLRTVYSKKKNYLVKWVATRNNSKPYKLLKLMLNETCYLIKGNVPGASKSLVVVKSAIKAN